MISDDFPQIWQEYRQLKHTEQRRRYLKNLIAAVYYMTLFTGDTQRRAAAMAIGNRVRQSRYARLDRKTVYKLWAMANDVAPQFKKHNRDFERAVSKKKQPAQRPQPQAPVIEVRKKKKLIK